MSDAPIRVVVADDQEIVRTGLRMILDAQPGIAVVAEASDGHDAIDKARRLRPDVCLLDIRMPGMDGLELAQALRRYAVPPSVVFVTAHDDRAVDAYEVGAVDYLLKPVRTDRLAVPVESGLSTHTLPARPPE